MNKREAIQAMLNGEKYGMQVGERGNTFLLMSVEILLTKTWVGLI